MALSLLHRKAYVVILIATLAVTFLTACSANTTTGASTSTATNTPGTANTSSTPTQPVIPPATATASTILKSMSIIGQPTAKMLSGTTFEVDGTVKNGDDKQHDIFIQATLLDATGSKIATTPIHNVDNVAAGATQTFTIQGTTTQPTWAKIEITIIKVSENIGGSGSD